MVTTLAPDGQAVSSSWAATIAASVLALMVVTGGVRRFLAQTGVDESTLPGDVKIALRQADDAIADL